MGYLPATNILTGSSSSLELQPYIVAATRTPLQLDRVSPSISYISADQMEFWQYRSLRDALTQEAGMVVATSGAIGAQTSVFTRGTNSDHTTFFLDGRRLNSGFSNQYAMESLSLNNLSSVQIQKGASSVNYGSSGIGGVVELRSRSAFDIDSNSSVWGIETGSNGYIAGTFSTVFNEKNLGVSVSSSTISTENERENDDYSHESISSCINYLLTDTLSLEFIGRYDSINKELPGSIASQTLYDQQQTDDWLISPGIRYTSDDLSLHLFYSRSESKVGIYQVKSAYDTGWNYLGDIPVTNQIKAESDEVNLQIDYDVTEGLLITTGIVYRNDYVSNSNLNTFNPLDDATRYDERFEQTGVFTQVLWAVEDIEVRGGVRFDDYSEFDSQLTSSIEGIYTFSDIGLNLFCKAASSYAPPSASDLAYDTDVTTSLNPEESDSYEVGLRHILMSGDLRYSLVLFHNEIDNLLAYTPSTFDTYNVASATTEGVECGVDYVASKKINLAASYTYLNATNDDTEKRLLRRPRHMLQLSANYQITNTISVGIQGVGYFDHEDLDAATYVQIDHEDSFVVNLVADWYINKHFSVFMRVENLLDETYEPVNSYPALRRAAYIGAEFSF